MSPQKEADQGRSYRSPMKSWAERASVRGLTPEGDDNQLFSGLPFSAALFPIVRHPVVEANGEALRHYLLARRALSYLDFTEELEASCVVPASFMLARGRPELGFGAEFRLDLYKVATDEAYHAYEACNVRHLLARMAGLNPLEPSRGAACIRLLDQRLGEASETERPIVATIFTTVSETLITSILMQLPNDETVMPLVRNKVAEHARDEARHHCIFRQVLQALWLGWTPAEKERYAPYFAEFMHAFLAPSLADYVQWLTEAGFPMAVAEQITQETFSESEIAEAVRASAQASIKEMNAIGMLQHAKLADSFGAAKLI